MRRRHIYNEKNRGHTLCGHRLTEQEKWYCKLNKPQHINCKRCLIKYRGSDYDGGRPKKDAKRI